jgi:hypothetical protein
MRKLCQPFGVLLIVFGANVFFYILCCNFCVPFNAETRYHPSAHQALIASLIAIDLVVLGLFLANKD